jgi:3-oxoacyl-[acyl-carrier-protein] synthase II
MSIAENYRVVITGAAPISAIGTGWDAFHQGLLRSPHHWVEVPSHWEKTYRYKSRFYSPLPPVDLNAHGMHSPFLRSMMDGDRMVLLGIKLALEQAGYLLEPQQGGRFAFEGNQVTDLILGTGIASLKAAMKANLAHTDSVAEGMETELGEKIRVDRMVVPMTMPSAAAAWGAQFFGLQGSAFTLNASCASGTIAIGEAFLRIQKGLSQRVITGGFEDLQDGFGGIMRGFDQIGTLTKNPKGCPEVFTPGRSGFLFSQGGAGILVLEERQSALDRGARILGEILDYRQINEAHSIVQVDPSGDGIRRLLDPLIKGFRIDLISPHATGTLANDLIESQVLAEFFSNENGQKPEILYTKGLLGHTIGASGALEVIHLLQRFHHTDLQAPALPGALEGWDNQNTLRKDPQRALSHSFGFGGHNAALAIGKGS